MRATERRVHEYVFRAPALTPRAEIGRPREWRRPLDRLLLRRLRPQGPRWTMHEEDSELVVGGGATGSASLWTRPLRLDAVARAEDAQLHVMTRATTGSGLATVRLVAHVRERATVGGTRSLAECAATAEDGGGWRGTTLDLRVIVDRALGTGRFLTCEVRVDATSGRDARDVVVLVRPPTLALTLARPGGEAALVAGG